MAVDDEKIEHIQDRSLTSSGRHTVSVHEREHGQDDSDNDDSSEGEIAEPERERDEREDEEKASHHSSERREVAAGMATASEDADPVAIRRPQSRASSTRSRTQTIVPRSKRRGLFGRFAILPEVERPFDYHNKTKWTITAIVAMAASCGPIGSSIFYPALAEMAIDLDASPTVTNLTIALYMLSMSIFPLWWSAFSETLGRRSIYLVSFSLFVVFSIISALSTNIAMLVVMRVLGGGASASVQAVGAGTLADIWEVRERGRAMGMFYLGPLTGPLFAPIIGGALSQHWGWKSTMWFLTIYGGLALVMIFFCLPETLAKRKPLAIVEAPAQEAANDASPSQQRPLARTASTAQSVQLRTKKTAAFLKQAFIDPLLVIRYLRFPPIAITVYWAAITFGALFVLNVSCQSAYSKPPYSFGELIIGLLYIPGSLGYFVASLVGGRWIDNIMAREARKAGRYDARGHLVYLPEDRMRENAWLAATVYPAALIWFGWSVDKGLPWPVPAVANFIFGFGSMLVFGAATTMLTEFMPRRSSGGIALNNFVRNIFSCVGAIVTQPLINVMGNGWLCTMLGLIAWISGYVSLWALRKYGPAWRKDMDRKLNGPQSQYS